MTHLELSDEDQLVLRDVLESDISDIGMEIADTDRMAWRDQLKARRAALQRVVRQLQPIATPDASHERS